MSYKWDCRYLKLAKEIAQWSLDPSTKIGAVAVGLKGQVLSQGFNGFPRGIKDLEIRLNNRETKYKFIVHGEMNMIYNAMFRILTIMKNLLHILYIFF
jgi:dCMP deaminase